MRRSPWSTLAGIFAILTFYLSLIFVALYIIFDAIAGATNTSATPFDYWYQTAIFVADIVCIVGLLGSIALSVKSGRGGLSGSAVCLLLAIFFGIGFAAFSVGTNIALQYDAPINSFLGIDVYKLIETGDGSEDTEYFKSDYYKGKGIYDDDAMRENSINVAKEVGVEGATLLWNNDNALPLDKTSSISLFGITSVDYLFGGEGSGHIGVTTSDSLKNAIEVTGIKVNDQLWNAYRLCRSNYGRTLVTDKTYIDPNDYEFTVGEVGWQALNSTSFGDVTDSLAQYGDAAVMIISRNGSENGDLAFETNECLDNCYLDLSYEEAEILEKLQGFKQEGKIKKIILLINSANAMQFKHIVEYDIDACMWVGMDGNASFYQIADLISGIAVPSGHLVDTYVYDVDSAPATENFGNYVYTKYDGVPATEQYSHNTKYVVYQEGIYVGYRYYETRYEDLVLGGRNAEGSAGVYSDKHYWSYTDEVIFPFGYGSSYTEFEHSNFTVKKVGDNYEVSLTIKNVGDTYSGKDVMQVYLQKPYTEYDMKNNVEKAAVELVGFAKTRLLAPGESETLTVTVSEYEFKSYDAYFAGTYILENGDYYLATGHDAHDALNNILAAKGKTVLDGMDKSGDSDFAEKITLSDADFLKYSTSIYTGYDIKNQFNDVDVNLYEGTKDQKIVYLSRKDWQGTYPSAVELSIANDKMVEDMQYGHDPIVKEGDVIPLYNTIGSYGRLSLIMLKGLDYDDPMWDELLNQLTWEETNVLCSYGAGVIAGAESVSAPGGKSKDGPCGIGAANPNLDSLMAIPSNTLQAATWNMELIERMGSAFGLEVLHVGYTGSYGVATNTHRCAYSGRTWEYYSEDGFLAGKMAVAEGKGLMSRGIILSTKHFALNDQETNRYGGSVWANEQAIREIYLKSFEIHVTEGDSNGIMSSFNRIGCTWAAAHKGLLTEVLRNEWDFIGIVISDAAVGTHMTTPEAYAEAIVAGNDLWMGGSKPNGWGNYKDNATVCQALRESAHRILYTQLNSNAMNGISASSYIVKIIPWWEWALRLTTEWLGILAGAFVVFAIIPLVRRRRF